jgi:hypothetical protein
VLSPGATAAREEERELRRRIAALQGEIAQRRNACAICPPAEQTKPATEVGIVLDTSLSMRWNADLTAAEEHEIENRLRRENPDQRRFNERYEELIRQVAPERSRMVAARAALIAAVNAMPPNVNVRYSTFGAVDPARIAQTRCTLADVGRFTTSDRPPLAAAIGRAEANASGTPLARAIAHAAQGLKDRAAGQPALIVIVTDGTENCGANVCTAYAEAKQADPELQLTIIDMAGNPQLGCIANAPGGRVLAASRASEAAAIIQQALAPPPPQSCIPRR